MLWKATAKPITYWLVGGLLIWLTLPAGLADLLIAPSWHAPHHQCDSLGIPIMQVRAMLLPMAGVTLALSGLLTWPATRRRQGGGHILDYQFTSTVWNWSAT